MFTDDYCSKTRERIDEVKTIRERKKCKNEKPLPKDEIGSFIRADSQYCLNLYGNWPKKKKKEKKGNFSNSSHSSLLSVTALFKI